MKPMFLNLHVQSNLSNLLFIDFLFKHCNNSSKQQQQTTKKVYVLCPHEIVNSKYARTNGVGALTLLTVISAVTT